MDINLIWCVKTQYEVDFSFIWINEVMSGFNVKNHYDISNNFDLLIDNSVIIVSVNKDPNTRLIEYINKYNDNNLKYSILHLSDEAFEQNIDFYKVSKKIIRNYYNDSYTKNFNLITIPLGYQTNVKYSNEEKTINFNFIGQLKSDRYEMLANFNQINNKVVHLTRMWNDPQGLNTTQYSSVLSRSLLTLCPRGWVNLDSFRINEALECKSIPVSVLDTDGTDYFEKVYGEHPFIIGTDWKDAYNKALKENLLEKYNDVFDWWCSYKESLKIKIKSFINE
jgi:hypothetical protein